MSPIAGAAIIAIGNELLSGKVADTNVQFLTHELRELGCPLCEVRWIPDDVEAIGDTFREVSTKYETVFSSGGVGPTHDDVTFAGLARAFGVRLVRNEDLAREMAAAYGVKVTEAVLRMADLPEGVTLLRTEKLRIPVVVMRNVYVLPGEPVIFRRKFTAIREQFRRPPFHLRKVFTDLDEGDIADVLAETEKRFGLAVGSYPRYDGVEYRVMITLESKEGALVEEAFQHLLSKLPSARVIRTE